MYFFTSLINNKKPLHIFNIEISMERQQFFYPKLSFVRTEKLFLFYVFYAFPNTSNQ